MNQTKVILIKFEVEKNEILSEINKLNNIKNELECKRALENSKLGLTNRKFSENETVKIAEIYVNYDGDKVEKYGREIQKIEQIIMGLKLNVEVIDEKIKVIHQEMMKNNKEIERKANFKSEKEMLDMKIVKDLEGK